MVSVVRIVTIIATISIAIAPAWADKRGVRVDGKAPVDYVAGQYGQSWAVVIGINDYEKVPRLNYAAEDAKAVAGLLKQKGYQVVELYDRDATRRNILRELQDRLVERVGEQDRVLVYYAGHGETKTVKGGKTMGYLLPVNGEADALGETAISMTMIRDLADALPSKHVLFLIDSCYGGVAGTQFRGLPKYSEEYLREITRERGRQLITAGGPTEQALEGPEWGHSVFTYYLLEGLGKGLADLNEDGIVPASELYTYLDAHVFQAAQMKNHKQRPLRWNLAAENGEFVFFTNPQGASPTNRTDRLNAAAANKSSKGSTDEMAAMKKRLQDLESKLGEKQNLVTQPVQSKQVAPPQEARARSYSLPSRLGPEATSLAKSMLSLSGKAVTALEGSSEAKAYFLRSIGYVEARIGDVASAKQSFEEALKAVGTISDIWKQEGARLAIARAQIKAGDREGATNILRQAKESAPSMGSGDLMADIAQLQAQNGTFQEALQTASTIGYKQPQGKALAWIAEEQSKAGDMAGAQSILRQALKFIEDNELYIANAQAKVGNMQGAIETALLAQKVETRDDAFKYIVWAQVEQGDVPGALTTVAMIQKPSGKVPALVSIAKKQVQSGDRSGASGTLLQALQAARATNAIFWFAAIAETQVTIGDRTGAMATYSEALEAVMAIGNSMQKSNELCFLAISKGVKAGDKEGGLELLDRAKTVVEAASASDPIFKQINRDTALSSVVGAYAEIKDYTKAMTVISALDSEYWRDASIGRLIRRRAESGQAMQAQSAIATIRDPRIRKEAAEAIAYHLAKNGDFTQALQWSLAELTGEIQLKALDAIGRGIYEWVEAQEKVNAQVSPS